MAYDEGLAQRIREALAAETSVSERKMFGGLCFMVRGNMCCGIVKDELMLRVGKDLFQEALSRPHARVMDFTGKASNGMVYVAKDGIATDGALNDWIDLGLRFVNTLPVK